MNWSRLERLVFLPLAFSLALIACGGGGAGGESSAGNGSIAFNLAFHRARDAQVSHAASFDCEGNGIATIEASVYDQDKVLLKAGGPWPCDAGQGTIEDVTAGTERTVVVLARDAAGNLIYQGQKAIDVAAGTVNNAGTIECAYFVPSPLTPTKGELAVTDRILFTWDAVEWASAYQILVSESEDLIEPLIDETTLKNNYTPSDLDDGKTYYWQVIAIDAYNISGAGSPIWSFTTNTPPAAHITAPAQGSTFTSRDNISFSGSGTDTEDGSLGGDVLVWTSDVDGEIGKGESFSTSDLSICTHQITLTVTDSEDATGTDIVTITVNTSPNNIDPVAQINTPVDGQTFTSSDDISFTGIGSDTEDGYLNGDALVWTSDADGEIGRGESFASDLLTPGLRTITLTVKDSDGGTATDSVNITVESLGPHGVTPLDLTGDVGKYSTLAVQGDKIFIGYYDETNQKLKFARSMHDGASWELQTLPMSGQAGKGASIAVDGDAVFISTTYISEPEIWNNLTVAVSNNNGDDWGWSSIMLGDPRTITTSSDDYATSIAVDGQNMFIAFLSSETYTMHLVKGTYACNDWEIVEFRQTGADEQGGCHPSMVEYNGSLYIGNTGHSDNIFLKYISNDLENQQSNEVEGVDSQGPDRFTATAIREVIESGDILVTYFFVAYFDQSSGNRDLKIARRHGGVTNFTVWTVDDTSEVVGKYPSMAVTGDTIFISYYDETNGNLKIARSIDNGENWERFVVDDSTDDVGQYSSLAANGQRVYISYYDVTNKNLKFAKSVTSGETWD